MKTTLFVMVAFLSGCSAEQAPAPLDGARVARDTASDPGEQADEPPAEGETADAPAAAPSPPPLSHRGPPPPVPPRVGTPPPEYHEVRSGLFRGGHPDRSALEYLKSLGVNTIVSLQQPDGSKLEGDSAEDFAAEEKDVASLSLRYVSVPMSSWSSTETYDQVWEQLQPLLAKPSGIYVHCQHGHDRTGLVIALERVFLEHWAPEKAHDEMIALGHAQVLVMLDRYFITKTGD
jgi:protein tyrosine phosphatase (PTP) superfamily phosphohydrolase (DUF442 family)